MVMNKYTLLVALLLSFACNNQGNSRQKKEQSSTSKNYLSGKVSGLNGTGLVLKNNDTDLLAVSASQFNYPAPYTEGSAYNVTIVAQPESPFQTCSLTKSTGIFYSGNAPDITATCINNAYEAGKLKHGDTPPDFVLPIYDGFGATFDFSQSAYSGKVTILSFVDIDIFNIDENKSWVWLSQLQNLRAVLGTNVEYIVVIFNSEGNITDANITNKLIANPVDLTGITLLRDNTWLSSVAKIYADGFLPANDPSFNGGIIADTWSYIISDSFYITDKWYKNTTPNNEPTSFNLFDIGGTPFNSADFANTETYVNARLTEILASPPM